MTGLLTRGQAARAAQVNIETLRYYERRGLIPQPPRTASGFRQYPAATVQRVRFIKRAQDLGFSLTDIAALLSLRTDAGTTCNDVRRRAEQKIAEVDEKIRALQRVKQALARLVKECQTGDPRGDCPILAEMEHQ